MKNPFQGEPMKIIKSLILTLILAGSMYAGEIGQPKPQPPPDQPRTKAVVTELLVVICQSLLSLR
jgi:hypothetical protein